MSTTRLRKQGSSIVVTIPASEAKNLDLDKEYLVKADEQGQVIISQLKSLDYRKRKCEYVEAIPSSDMEQINQMIAFIFE